MSSLGDSSTKYLYMYAVVSSVILKSNIYDKFC
jgi:hypothetical protein